MFPDLFYKIDTFLPNGISQRIIMIDTPSLSGVYATRPIDMTEGSRPDQTCPGPYGMVHISPRSDMFWVSSVSCD